MRHTELETVFILTRRNYKVYADIGVTWINMQHYVKILYTGSGSRYVRNGVLSDQLKLFILPLRTEVDFKDAGNNKLNIQGTMDLTVQLSTRLEIVRFYVVYRLSTDFIPGLDFCDKHVATIRQRQSHAELDEGTIFRIIWRPSCRWDFLAPL